LPTESDPHLGRTPPGRAPSRPTHDLRSTYDVWHQRIHDADPGHDDASSPWYRLVAEYIGPVAGLRVLEVACGRGGFVRALAAAGAIVTGCDFSAAALRAAGQRVSASSPPSPPALIQADAQNLPFATASFDLLVSCETIEHLPDVQSAVNEMYRVVRPGARLLLTTPNYANFMGLYDLYARLRHPARKDDQPFDRRQWFPQVHYWLRRAGWRILRTDGTVHQFPLLPGHNPVRWHALESTRLLRKLFSPFAFTYFVLAEKSE
jgi:SAM-dependent methyltransferase